MEVHAIGWAALAAIIITMITIDIVGHVRTPHEPTIREAAWWSLGYIGFALAFGGLVWAVWGADFGQQYFAGYVTEKALSVDNLFVFVLIITAFRVPRKNQQEVLLAGIVIALVLRLAFILVGKAMIESWSWVFYPFGLWLLWTAFSQIREGAEDPGAHQDEEYRPPSIVKWVSRVVPVTDGFIGARMLYRHGGRTYVTPLLLCVIAIGTADVMFAVDSIPAIFGVTSEPFLVFSCTVFALMGLRQLFFLVDSLLSRLVYLGFGLGAILAFIGVKLILEALRGGALPFVAGGAPLTALPEISSALSLCVVVSVLAVTVVASLVASSTKEGTTRE